MKKESEIPRWVVWLFFVLGFLVSWSPAWAQSGGGFVLEWSTIDGGAGVSSAGQYVISGTIAQPDAGAMANGRFELSGGFWPGGPVCFVEFDDYARFADYWFASGSGLPADLYQDDYVDWHDLREFAYEWLYECPHNWPLE
ncbi:MAG: hypothetical protein ACYTBJ_07540 [Planctomycetota bacterium]|jgi:hypothetical protein